MRKTLLYWIDRFLLRECWRCVYPKIAHESRWYMRSTAMYLVRADLKRGADRDQGAYVEYKHRPFGGEKVREVRT